MHSLLIRRPEITVDEGGDTVEGVETVKSLTEVLRWVERANKPMRSD